MDEFIEYYFGPLFHFFADNFWLIPTIVGSAMLIVFIFFLILGIKHGRFNYEGFFTIAVLTLLGLVLLYSFAAFGFAFGRKWNDLNWTFWSNYINFSSEQSWYIIILCIIAGLCALGAGIFGACDDRGVVGFIIGLLLGFLAGGIVSGLLWLVIFVLYVVVAFLIQFFICIGLGFAGAGVSIVKFFQLNWLISTAVFIAPGLFVGLIVAFKNYVFALKNTFSRSLEEKHRAVKVKP